MGVIDCCPALGARRPESDTHLLLGFSLELIWWQQDRTQIIALRPRPREPTVFFVEKTRIYLESGAVAPGKTPRSLQNPSVGDQVWYAGC